MTSIVTVDGSSDPISSYQYTYNLAGEPTSKTETQNALSGTPVVTNYTNDDQGQLTQEDPDNAAATDYNWDANGNNDDATIGSYNQMTSDGTWNYYLYDAKGNLTKKMQDSTFGEYWEYTYSIGNQLTHVEHSSNGTDIDMTEDNYYDVFGNLLKQVVDADGDGPNAATTVYRAIDGENNLKPTPIGLENYDVFAEINGSGSLITRYVRGDRVDELLGHLNTAAAPHAGAFWTITDSLGSIRDTVDNSGTVVDSVSYTAFGTVITDVDSSYRSKFGFTGRDYDSATTLQYNRARWYDAETKQFLGQDPKGFAAGDSNLKRYVNNAPTYHSDPSGFEWRVIRDNKVPFAQGQYSDPTKDTIAGLAKKAKLDSAEFGLWLSVVNVKTKTPVKVRFQFGDQNRTIEDLYNLGRFGKGAKVGGFAFHVPNFVVAYWGGNGNGAGQWWVDWNDSRKALEKRGLMVGEFGMGQFKNIFGLKGVDLKVHVPVPADELADVFKELSDKKMLYGTYYWGHGDQIPKKGGRPLETEFDGLITNGTAVATLMGAIGLGQRKWVLKYDTIGPSKPASAIEYHLGLGLFFACGGEGGYVSLTPDATRFGIAGTLLPWGKADPFQWLHKEVESILQKQFDEPPNKGAK